MGNPAEKTIEHPTHILVDQLVPEASLFFEILPWQNLPQGVGTEAFFETDGLLFHLVSQPSVREPRENRGRLRHCNGLQTPIATGSAKRSREGGSEV